MATYRLTSGDPIGFTAEVTFRSGYVETQCDFLTEASALDWIAERLVGDVRPAKEG
jgi:hypothetical protein